MLAQGLQSLLEPDFPAAEIVQNEEDLLKAVAKSKPDVVLAAIEPNRIDAIHRLVKISPATKVIVLTMQDQPEHVAEAFRAGASGYVLKRGAFSELMIAIRQVLDGCLYLTPLIRNESVFAALNGKTRPNHTVLTQRQREVLRLVAQGCTAKDVANALNVSVKTAVFHKTAIMDKLGLRTTAALTRYALENRIVPMKADPLACPTPHIPSTDRDRHHDPGVAVH